MHRKNIYISLFIAIFSFATGVYAERVYTDVPKDHWAAPAIDFMSEHEIMSGPDGKEALFDPAGQVNRAQMAIALTRLYTRLNSKIESLELEVARLQLQQ